MKITRLRRNIIINLSASIILLVMAISILFYISQTTSNSESTIAKIHASTAEVKNNARDLESQTNDARKYKEIWKTLSENKKNTQGIKMEEVNSKLDSIAEKYNITNKTLQILLPENLDSGVFNRKTITISYAAGTLAFDALSDVRAINFINDFFNNLSGYVIITNIELNKSKAYSDEDLINISLGKNSGAIKVKISFAWYVPHEKEKK